MRFTLRGLVVGYLSALSADHAAAGAAALIDEYERYMPDNAQSQRIRLHLMHGDLHAATAARRRFELLSVRLGSMSDARLFDLHAQLTLYTLSDDSTGLRRTLLALREVASTRAGWQPRAILAEAQLLRCQGHVAEGLRTCEALLRELPALCLDYGQAAASHVELLNAAQRWSDAVSCGEAYLEGLQRAGAPEYRVELMLCQALSAQGDHTRAEALFEHAREQLEGRSVTGVLTGVTYEIGARLALQRGDVSLARARLVRCADRLWTGKHPALLARYHALSRQAEQAARVSWAPAALPVAPRAQLPLTGEATATTQVNPDRGDER